MSMSRKILNTVLLGAALSAAPAHAYVTSTSWQGGDYTRVPSTVRSITVYDGENDKRPVRGEWRQSGDSAVKKLVNGKGWDTSVSTSTSATIRSHRVVEEIAVRPDAYGPWINTKTGKAI